MIMAIVMVTIKITMNNDDSYNSGKITSQFTT